MQPVLPDQRFQTLPLRSFSHNATLKIESLIAQPSAGANQECVILHRMEASYGQQGKLTARTTHPRRGLRLFGHIDPKSRDNDLSRVDCRKVLPNIAAVVLGNGYAEPASLQLRVQIGAVDEQVRPVQRQTIAHSQQSRRHHCDPRPEIAVMHVDMVYAAFLQLNGVVRSQPRVQQGFQSTPG